ncbi:MAG: hypothetical protein GY913_21690 [Proteobacteria bacterium]|nr:hypothetical protein [Actinomycetes bacterium]MCP4919523.1 hypothetical protein [Pseudomonadota bacterium]
MTGYSWFADARRVPLEQLAVALGLSVSRRTISPCPACGRRGRDSACRIYRAKDGTPKWKCWHASCDGRGDGIDLARYVISGDLRNWYAERGWCERRAGGGRSELVELPPPPPEPGYVPEDDLRCLLGQCGPGLYEPDVGRWLHYRLGDLAERTGWLVLSLPKNARCPDWARVGRDHNERSWAQGGFRALFPVWNHQGQLRSIRARQVVRAAAKVKCIPPRDHKAGGTVLANPAALAWLRARGTPQRIVVTEGEPQWLAWSVASTGSVAVVGITSGSWTQDFADRVPDGCQVLIATDLDKAGEGYAALVRATLEGRDVNVDRWAQPTQMLGK